MAENADSDFSSSDDETLQAKRGPQSNTQHLPAQVVTMEGPDRRDTSVKQSSGNVDQGTDRSFLEANSPETVDSALTVGQNSDSDYEERPFNKTGPSNHTDMNLTVDILPQENIRLSVNPSDTLSEIKDQIERKYNLPKAEQGFFLHKNRQLLEEGKSLSVCGLKSGDKLVLPQSLSVEKHAKRMKRGMKVKAGPDWPHNGRYRKGEVATVTKELYQDDGGQYVDICWDSDGVKGVCGMGNAGKYYILLG